MDAVFDLLDDVFGDNLILSVLVFLAGATVAFFVMATLQMRHASQQAAQLLMDYATRHFSGSQRDDQRELKRRLVQAGFLDPRAPAFFFLARILTGLGLALAALLLLPSILDDFGTNVWFFVWPVGLAGYFVPNFYLKRRIRARENEHRAGFPDFMDLLVV